MLIFSLFKSAACHPTSSRSVLFYQLYMGAYMEGLNEKA